MAFRLDKVIVCGEIINTRKNTVQGWIGLRDRESPVPLHLTGNCDADLFGRHLRFRIREEDDKPAEGVDLSSFANQQIGPTGTMTAARFVLGGDSSPEELILRAKLNEPLPAEWKRCLYLEWFSQNGRVVIELVDPVLEFVEPDGTIEQEISEIIASAPGEDADIFGEYSPAAIEEEIFDAGDDEEDDDDDDDEEDDPYGLFPEGLQDQLEADGDPMASEFEHDPDMAREVEMMDSLLESGTDVPVGSIFDPPLQLPPPDQLDDTQVEAAFKTLLARMAQYGIALDMCVHYTPREAYKLLIERICKEEGVFPQLRQTQWVQHFMTHDFCPLCEGEIERDYESNKDSDEPSDEDSDEPDDE